MNGVAVTGHARHGMAPILTLRKGRTALITMRTRRCGGIPCTCMATIYEISDEAKVFALE